MARPERFELPTLWFEDRIKDVVNFVGISSPHLLSMERDVASTPVRLQFVAAKCSRSYKIIYICKACSGRPQIEYPTRRPQWDQSPIPQRSVRPAAPNGRQSRESPGRLLAQGSKSLQYIVSCRTATVSLAHQGVPDRPVLVNHERRWI